MWKETNKVLSEVIIAPKHFQRVRVQLMLGPMRDYKLKARKNIKDY